MKKSLGLTIIEVLLAISILVIGVLAIASLFPFGYRLSTFSKEMTVATNLAQDKTEKVISKHYDDLPPGILEPKQRVENNPQSQFYFYQGEVKIDLVDENLNETTSDQGLKKITTVIYFLEGGKEKEITLVTLKAKR